MSRIRIVKGKYIKITHGDHNMSTEGHIVSNAAGEIREKGNENGIIYNNFERKGSEVNDDFEIKLSLKKDKSYSSVVPFGILDFKGNYENAHFVFDYSLMLGNIDSLDFKILNEDGSTLYAVKNLPEVVVPSRQIPLLAQDLMKKRPKNNPLQPKKVWDWKSVFDPYNIMSGDYTKIGSYVIFWDGFDNNEIYDSTKFDNKKLKAVIVAKKNGKEKTKEVEFTTNYSEVDWVDVKIDKKNKRIDTTLRVNLKDGGEEGLGQHVSPVSSTYPAKEYEIKYDWDKVSKEALAYYNKPPIKKRLRSYKDLEKLSLEGINQFWSRNSKNIGQGVKIISDVYEVFIDAQSNKNGLSAPSIIYQTNMEDGRSRNFELSRKLFFYEGYLYRNYWKESNPKSAFYKNKGWIYRSENKSDEKNVLLNLPPLVEDYKMVSAHEIGHEILLAYGGQYYSKSHKGSTTGINIFFQETDKSAPDIPNNGEIDLMKYYQNYYDVPRTIISEFDLLKVIWLSKIKIS